MFCRNCYYSLENLGTSEHRCPECGRAFDPNDDKTYETDVAEIREHERTTAFFIIASVILCGAALLLAWTFGLF